ncbi:TRAP transporter small permease subunit [Pararhodobacter sp. SW119]|uniref:TRAP transporter small permease n=1 Tax=Pararhodobacter sp. SW119 TaxID=2780075 RepID=UPI001AE02626|nr:TRAP transporter small permease subunit [Pararhodobacter sp. SW119]
MTLVHLLRGISDILTVVERWLLTVLIAGVAGFVLINVSFRAFGVTLAWADESAILSMTLATFVGASLMLRARSDPAMRVLHEVATPLLLRALRVAASAMAVTFAVLLAWLCWRWFDLPGLSSAGYDIGEFELRHFNFLYTEVTPVLGLPYWWFYLIMPWFALTLIVHALTNLVEDLGLIDRRASDLNSGGEG